MVECQLPKLEVAGSSPVIRSEIMGFSEARIVQGRVIHCPAFH
jgi:hypothetical protein